MCIKGIKRDWSKGVIKSLVSKSTPAHCNHKQFGILSADKRFCEVILKCMDPNKHLKTALKWAPERRSHGGLKETWQGTAEKERTALGFGSWSKPAVATRDRVTWQKRVTGPLPTQGYGEIIIVIILKSLKYIFYIDWNAEEGDNQASNGKVLTAASLR